MKFITTLTLFVVSALAMPATPDNKPVKRTGCTPVSYRCKDPSVLPTGEGWDVCAADGNWVYGGACPSDHHCTFVASIKSPFCVPNPAICTPGDLECTVDGYQTCDATGNHWVLTTCPAGEVCTVLGGTAHCKPKDTTTGSGEDCTPGTYRCKNDKSGWEVCQVWNEWVDGGNCSDGTSCWFNELNQSPYCI